MKIDLSVTFIAFFWLSAACLAQSSDVLNELDSLPVSEAFDNMEFNKTIHEADGKIRALKEDSIRIAETKILRADGKIYIPKCIENSQLFLNELTLLERLCESKRINAKVLKSLKFRFITIYISDEEGAAHMLKFPDTDSVIRDYRYRNLDTLCLAKPIDFSNYPALSQFIEKDFFTVLTNAKNQVMPMPVDDMQRVYISDDVEPEYRTEEYYEERSAMLGVRIKNLLSKAKNNYPDESVPSYEQYLQNESRKQLNYKELASYRQNALKFLTHKYDN